MTDQPRSVSRGRDAFTSSGRGGAGNIRPTSNSAERPTDGPDDFSPARGREPATGETDKIYSTGRGGFGNIRSPSRDEKDLATRTPDVSERTILKEHAEHEQNVVHSTGRGGLGNFSRSRSRGAEARPADEKEKQHHGLGNILHPRKEHEKVPGAN